MPSFAGPGFAGPHIPAAPHFPGLHWTPGDGAPWTYWESGSGSAHPMVVLHGLGGDHTGLQEMLSHLREVRIIGVDLPGYGATAALGVPHTLENYAAALEEFRAAVGVSEFHLLGHSLGASIALVYAAKYGHCLRSLCLLNPVSADTGLTATLGKLYYGAGARMPAGLRRLWLASRLAVYLSNRAILTTKDKRRRRQIMEADYTNYRRASTRAMVETFLSYHETPFPELASNVMTDSLLLAGGKDGIASPASVRRLHDPMPSSRLEIVPPAGHLAPLEQPADIAAIVNDFLAEFE